MVDAVNDALRDRYRGCMLGLAIGDALGMPVETMTREEILAATNGRGVCGFLAPIQTRFDSLARLRPGQWTDDTQLSLAIARSLVRKRRFDLADIATEHGVEFGKYRRGWGGSTRIGIQEIVEGVRMVGDPVRDPAAHGMGNGVAMKITPLALFLARAVSPVRHQDAMAMVRQLAELTHRDPCATTGAALVGLTTWFALELESGRTDVHTFRWAMRWLTMACSGMDRCPMHPRAFTDRLIALPGTADIAEVAARTGTSCAVYESVPFVLGTVMHHASDFRTGVLAAVNAGGDTDSNGAMVGAILGALHGASAIPEEWRTGVEDAEEIVRLADGLLDLALAGM